MVSITPQPCFTNCTGGWVDPRASLDTEARWKILSPLPGIEPQSPRYPACSQTLYWLSYPAHSQREQRDVKTTMDSAPRIWVAPDALAHLMVSVARFVGALRRNLSIMFGKTQSLTSVFNKVSTQWAYSNSRLESHHPDDKGSKHLWNTGQFLPDDKVQQPRRPPRGFLVVYFTTLFQWPYRLYSIDDRVIREWWYFNPGHSEYEAGKTTMRTRNQN
jgi:hypothetical protein